MGPSRGSCGRCLADGTPPWARVISAVVYNDHARSFLLRAKIAGRRELFDELGHQLTAAIRGSGIARGCDAIVSVPSHPWVNLRRGFQPARLLSAIVARALRIPLRSRDLRVRPGSRLQTKKLSAAERKRARSEAFIVRTQKTGSRVLLVDDVMTTGSTLLGCTAQLLAAGAAEVRVAVWARTPRFVDHRVIEG